MSEATAEGPPTGHPQPSPQHHAPPPNSPRDAPPPMDGRYGGYSGYPPPPHGYPPPPPHYPSYGPPPPGSSSGYPPPPPHGYYPPHYGYGHPPPYGYPGYSGYPTQQQMHKDSSRGAPSRTSTHHQLKSSPSPSRSPATKPKTEISQQAQEDIEQERIRATVEPIEVKPMKTDYHFFVEDNRDRIQTEAEQEVSNENKFLLYSNMNARMLKSWMDTASKAREDYFTKEEDDRQRFMNDDEIASRHCATLTARARSPRGDGMDEKEGGGDDCSGNDSDDSKRRETGQDDDDESPTKKIKVEEGASSE